MAQAAPRCCCHRVAVFAVAVAVAAVPVASCAHKAMTGGVSPGGGGGRPDHGHVNPMDQYVQMLSPPAGSGSASAAPPPDPASVRAVLHQALTNPRVYSGFAELRSLPPVVEALEKSGSAGGGGDAALRTLELFAYGTYSDYAKAPEGTYLRLTDAQSNKLRQLTVVSLALRIAAESAEAQKGGARTGGRKAAGASTCGASVPYSALRSELGLPPDSSVRELEDLLISCVYSGLIVGRLDQRAMSLLVGTAAGAGGHGSAHQPPCASRDVRLDDLPRMISALESFRRRGEEVARSLEEAASAAGSGRRDDAARWEAVGERIDDIRARARERAAMGPEGPGGGMADAWGAMDVMGGGGDGSVAMDISVEGGGGGGAPGARAGGLRRQSKRSRGGYAGGFSGEAYGRY